MIKNNLSLIIFDQKGNSCREKSVLRWKTMHCLHSPKLRDCSLSLSGRGSIYFPFHRKKKFPSFANSFWHSYSLYKFELLWLLLWTSCDILQVCSINEVNKLLACSFYIWSENSFWLNSFSPIFEQSILKQSKHSKTQCYT